MVLTGQTFIGVRRPRSRAEGRPFHRARVLGSARSQLLATGRSPPIEESLVDSGKIAR
jgi:hypothetical protein